MPRPLGPRKNFRKTPTCTNCRHLEYVSDSSQLHHPISAGRRAWVCRRTPRVMLRGFIVKQSVCDGWVRQKGTE